MMKHAVSIRYAIHPGYVYSRIDGQLHYISYKQLITLYNISPYECMLWEDGCRYKFDDYIHLYPRYNGDYKLEDRHIKDSTELSGGHLW